MISKINGSLSYGELIVAYCIIGAVIMYSSYFLMRRFVPKLIAADIDADFLAGLHAALFTITFLTLGYGLVNASETVDRFQQNVEVEANELRTLDFLLNLYGLPETGELRQDLRKYVKSIVHDEWPALSKRAGSDVTLGLQRKFRTDLSTLNPINGRELVIYSEVLRITEKVIQARSTRISDSSTKVAPQFMMASYVGYICILIISAIMLTQFTWVRFITLNIQIFAVAFIFAATITLDNPFVGSHSISPDSIASLFNQTNALVPR